MIRKSGIIKKYCCIMAFILIFSGLTVNSHAETKGQKSIGDIGVDITWYDFGKAYTDYYIQNDYDTGIYEVHVSNNSEDQGKMAFVNGKGELVLKPETYEGCSSRGRGDEITILLQKGDKYFYIDSAGIKEMDGKAYTAIESFMEGYATATLKPNGHKGVIDKNGKLIFEDKQGKYKGFEYIGNGIFSANIDDNLYDLLDITGEPLTSNHYGYAPYISEETIRVNKDKKYGFLNLSGTEIVPLSYDYAVPFYEGLAVVSINNKWGFIDKTGKEVISRVYDEARSFNNGFAIVALNNKWGVINKLGSIVIPFEYDRIVENAKGSFNAQKDNKLYILNFSGEIISTKEYSCFDIESNNRIYVEKNINNFKVSGFLDKNEKILTGFKEFEMIYLSDDLYLGVKSGEYPPGVVPPHDYDQRFALMDSQGNNLTGFKYSNTGDFYNNYQVVFKYYYNKVGLVNKYGAEVLPTIFDDILLTAEGYAFVSIRDPETGDNSRVGYFKIPENFSDKKTSKPITVYLDGIELYFESEPIIKKQRTMIPMRKIFEALGAEVKWDKKTKSAIASIDGKEVRVSIGSEVAYVNASKIQLETSPFIQKGITFVPLRFVSENLGADVKWDGEARRVIITSDN